MKKDSLKSEKRKREIALPKLPEGKFEAYIPYSAWRGQARFRHQFLQQVALRKEIFKYLVRVGIFFIIFYAFAGFHLFGGRTPSLTNMLLYLYLAAISYPLVVAPTNLQIGSNGIRLHWISFSGLFSSPWISWDSVDAITYTNFSRGFYKSNSVDFYLDPSRTSLWLQLLLRMLVPFFGSVKMADYRTLKLRVDTLAISHDDDISVLLRTVKEFVPAEKLSTELEQLQEQSGHSFTKLWLDSLDGGDRLKLSSGALEPGDTVLDGRYEILRRLAAGGQAVTYLAQDGSDQIVLKEFILPVRGGMEIRKRALENVEHEAKLLQKLDSNYIVKIIDCFVDGPRAYLVLEYISGKSLRKRVQDDGPLSETECKRLALSMCSVLDYLHTLPIPIVHRDFTPENLLLRSDDELALIDFNVAEQLESKETKTVVGKHCYVAPEQFRGRATPQSDIYSCGCTLYWLLTGEDPEPISTSHPQLLRPHISFEFDDIVARATATDAGKRFASAAEMRQALEQIEIESEAVT